MPVACLLSLGLLCLTTHGGELERSSPGFALVATYATPTYRITHTNSDVHRPRDVSQLTALCRSSDCIRVKVDVQGCEVRFEFAEPSDPMAGWTGESYTVVSQTSAGLAEGLANAHIAARKGRAETLRSLKDVVGARAIRCPA